MAKRSNTWDNDREIHKWAKETGRKGYTGNRSRDTMVSADDRKAYYDDQMNNYDNRIAMDAWNLAVKDEEFRKTLGKKDQKSIESYMDDKRNKKGKGGEKDGQIVGISNFREFGALQDFQRSYHKNTKNSGGQFSSANDRGGNTMDMQQRMREHYMKDYMKADDMPEAPKDDAQTPDSLLPDDYTPSPQLTRARDIVGTFEDGVLQSQDGLLSSAALGEIATKNTVADDTQAASAQNAIAQSYLDNHTLNLKEGFQKYGIRTSGPNSTASRNDELMQGLG